MEQVIDSVEIQERRQEVAKFIQASIDLRDEFVVDVPEEEWDSDAYVEVQDFEVREYQLDAWGALWDARQAGAKKGLIPLATGLGKTSVAVFDVIKFREEYTGQRMSGPRILFASHKNEINEQAAERFATFIPDATQGIYNGDEKNLNGDITFATLQSLFSNLDKLKQGYFDYIIYDEAHHAQANTFKAVVEHFRPKFQLALTATPKRLDGLDIEELFGSPLYSKSLSEAIAEGLLADVDYHIVFDDAVKEAMQSGFEQDSLKALYELLSVRARNEVIVKNIREEKQRIGLEDAKTIVFCEGIDHAEEIAELLSGQAYHSEVDKKERKKLLDAFRVGEFEDIVTRDMFNEGVDVPDARLLVFLRSTSSPTVFEQQLGRGLRKAPGKDRVSVLDFVANVERVSIIRDLVEKIRKYRPTDPIGIDNVMTDTWPDDLVGTVADEGLKIHTGHGDFDFDRLAVDILDRFSSLRESANRFTNMTNVDLVSLAIGLKPEGPLSQREIKALSVTEQFLSSGAIERRFGSIVEFQKACGFEDRLDRKLVFRTVSNDEIVAAALDLSPDRPLNTPAINELSRDRKFLSSANIIARFGSITEFQKACGFQPSDSRTLTKELSNEDLVEIALSVSPTRPLSPNQMKELTKQGRFVSNRTLGKRFGSMVEFQKACGFESVDYAAYNDEELVKRALELKSDGPLQGSEIKALSKQGEFMSLDMIRKRFGSMVEFQKACGFESVDYAAYNDEELVKRALELKSDGPLNAPEIRELSKQGEFIGLTTITNRFGSVRAFQQACGF